MRAPGRSSMRSRTGVFRTATPDPRTAPPSRALSTTPCAARLRPRGSWGEDDARSVLLGMLKLQRGMDGRSIGALFSGERYAPALLTESERDRLETATLADAPASVAGDFPEWIEPALREIFGDDLVAELQGLATRAPLDLRVNRLKAASRKAVHDELAHLNAVETPHSPLGLRVLPLEDGRGPAVQAEPEFLKGLDRNPGRRVATGEPPFRREAGRAGGRSLRWRRGENLGSRRHDEQSRPDLRHRQRRAPPCAHPRAPDPRGCPQRPDPHAAGGAPMRYRTWKAKWTQSSLMRPVPDPALGGAIRMPSGGLGPEVSKHAARSRRRCSTGQLGS